MSFKISDLLRAIDQERKKCKSKEGIHSNHSFTNRKIRLQMMDLFIFNKSTLNGKIYSIFIFYHQQHDCLKHLPVPPVTMILFSMSHVNNPMILKQIHR